MKEPKYKRPFSPRDFRGYFKWNKALTKSLYANLYHACHRDELEDILDWGSLQLRSNWSIRLPEHGLCKVPGVWTGLNYYNAGNYYGPFLIKFPLKVLNGKRFMAFRRTDSGRNRYFFVQYEARIPIFSFRGEEWRSVNPKTYFDEDEEGQYSHKPGAIYDIVLTQTVPFSKAQSVKAVSHPKCVPEKCTGLTRIRAQKQMVKIAANEFVSRLEEDNIIQEMLQKFPDLDGEIIKLAME